MQYNQNSQFWVGDSKQKDDHRGSSEAVRGPSPISSSESQGSLIRYKSAQNI